ncbi:hypothetical protein FACS189427_13920 [Planctomycetales bacterium]|nr:hypothetical protein FACS189427_13920 [Planctomycetales bacterium]
MLFGGKTDADGKPRVQVSSGGMTAFLRGEWKLNEILSGKDEKNRNDHRHHAVDAVVIACNETATIQKLAAAAERASELEIHRLFVKGGVEVPFDGFKQQVNDSIDRIIVSFRPDLRVSGGLHNETNYSPVRETTEKTNDGNWKRYHSHHIRKFVTSLTTEKQINAIVDSVIRQIVMEKFHRLEGKTKKFNENDLPFMTTKDGRHIPIKKVRVRDNTTTITLGEGKVNERFVAAGGNHHLEVFYLLDKNGNKTYDKLGNERIDWKCVSLFATSQRLSRKEDVIRKSDHYENGKTLTQLSFSLPF